MATYLICHGAWSAGWAWKKLRPLLQAAGHDVYVPTYTGLGERGHLAHPMVDLETHIQDILAVAGCEGLEDVILVGHSYGGMVATGVADRAPGLVRQLVYLDAFVPNDGECLADLVAGGTRVAPVEGWLLPPNPSAPDTSPADLEWIAPRRRHQPVRCFTQALRLTGAVNGLPRSYIHCTKKVEHDNFRQFADRFRDHPDWRFLALDASHSPNVTAPEALAALLLTFA